jgi:hypothetical protein
MKIFQVFDKINMEITQQVVIKYVYVNELMSHIVGRLQTAVAREMCSAS